MNNPTLSFRWRAVCLIVAVSLVLGLGLGAAAYAQDDSLTGKRQFFLNTGGPTASVTQVLFTPSGKELITLGEDKAIRFWEADTGRLLGCIYGQVGPGSAGKLFAAALSADGKTLAVTGKTSTTQKSYVVRILRLESLATTPIRVKCVQLLHGPIGSVQSLAFSHDDTQLACGSGDSAIYVWSRENPGADFRDNEQQDSDIRTTLTTTDGQNKFVTSIAFSPDDKQIASANGDGSVRVWTIKNNKNTEIGHHTGIASVVAWTKSPSGGSVIASGGVDGHLILWDGGGKRIQELPRQNLIVSSLAFSPDGRRLAWGLGQQDASDPCPVRVWSPPDGNVRSTYMDNAVRELPHDATVRALAFSPDSTLLASAGGVSYGLYLWNAVSGKLARSCVGKGTALNAVAWSLDGSEVGWKQINSKAASYDFIFDLDHAAQVFKTAGIEWQTALTRNPTDNKQLSASPDRTQISVRQGDRETSHFRIVPENSPNAATDKVLCYTFTPKSGQIVVGSAYSLALFDASGRRLANFIGHTGAVAAVSVSPDGRYLASASVDQTVLIWPLPTSASDSDPAEEIQPLLGLFSSTDGRWVAWTQKGFFTASPNGDDLATWQINPGVDKVTQATDVWQYTAFNKSEVIAHIRATGIVTDADTIDQSEPPTVEIISAKASGGKIKLVASIKDINTVKRKIKSIKVTNNRKIVSEDADVSDDGLWTRTIDLKPGQNRLSLVATNDAGSRSKPADAEVDGPTPPPHDPHLFMLSIGIAQYPGGSPYELEFPAKDARDIAAVFQGQDGKLFKKGTVTVQTLTDRDGTKKGIEAALNALKARAGTLQDNDYTIVFVAGHGWSDPLDQFYFIPWDIDPHSPETVERTAVKWTEFQEALSGLPGKVILFLDACHSAGIGGGYAAALRQVSDLQRQDATNLTIFASCQPYQKSHEMADWNNGAFTKVLIDGLTNRYHDMTVDPHGDVTIGALQGYVGPKVAELTKTITSSLHETPQSPAFQILQIGDTTALTSVSKSAAPELARLAIK